MYKPSEKKRAGAITFTICSLLALLVWGVFGQTLRHGFINYDDGMYVYENPVISKGVTLEGARWIITHPHGENWHPLTSLSNMLDCQLYGLNPVGHHRTNVLLHMATAILLFLVLRQMTGSLWRSAFVAAVFAIHPLRVESVAWISERKDMLSGLFFMLTLGAYTRYTRVASGGWGVTSRRYLAVVLFFVLGLMSKAMLVTLPFVLLLLDFWPLKRFQTLETKKTIVRLVLEKIPLLLLAAVFCGVTIWAQQGAIASDETLPVLWRFENALCSYVIYIKQLIFPSGLALFYPYPKAGFSPWKIGLSLILLAGVSLAVFINRKKRPYLMVGWLWYLGLLVPVIGIIQVGAQAHADRYTYLPQIGLVIMATWLVTDWCSSLRCRRTVLSTAAAAVLTVLAIAAHRQTRHWCDSISLWTHTLACTDGNYLAHVNLGNVFYKNGSLEGAVEQYEKALEIAPGHAKAHVNLGTVFLRQGQVEKAISHFGKALEINPNDAKGHCNLGALCAEQGQIEKAISHLEKALEIDPGYAKAHVNLGTVFLRQGQVEKAIPHFGKALEINPDDVEVQNNLAWILATCPDAALRNGQRAVELARSADRLSGRNCAPILDTLAAAYAEAGQYPEAVTTARRALNAATGQESVADGIRVRLRLYEKRVPYHESRGKP